ncbi:MAG: DUF3418 domain-containing protein [Kiritimatiellaeota bacterium]|nr:DUF3418 domain-containing protein [Kiritimatiellota bacterium]
MRYTFPSELPITAYVDEIADALRQHQVLIVCGDTGSGKTTQLPKIALKAGRGTRGLIGCTQPRRLAATTMARRVAEELDFSVDHSDVSRPDRFVGYQHRFESRLSKDTVVKFMTDGILLAETRHDRLFRKYDTLIIDEAHERSLNIDFLLGILKHILPHRPDLNVIISSATLDEKRFSVFFDDAPIVSVPGRLYPIETRWLAPDDDDDPDLPRQIANAVDELIAEERRGHHLNRMDANPCATSTVCGDTTGPGDILVFLPGERDIREATEVLTGRRLPRTEIIPLLASLPAGEQQRAFNLSPNRRIILSTNVAETSVTLPGIRYVIDSGLVRLSRYNPRTQVQRLQIEPVSQASANQRKGRCGRIAPGICVRLYSEDDFNKRDDYTPPEILRSSLARVILTMMDLKLGDIEAFPFIDAPSHALIKEGYRELELLDAIAPSLTPSCPPVRSSVLSPTLHPCGITEGHKDRRTQGGGHSSYRLTRLGRELARLPIDPAFARILFAAHHEKALADTLIVVAALEGDDPRRRPLEKSAEADKCHARFLTPNSDFSALIRLWRWWGEQTAKGSQTVARRVCKDNFLSYPKMRDWMDLCEQLASICKALGLDVATTSGGEAGMHRALLTGLLSNLGQRDPDTGDYRGGRGIRFALFPGSGLVKRSHGFQPEKKRANAGKMPLRHSTRDWIIAGELVETSRLYARTAACIDPAWVEPIAKRHCKYSYHSLQWDGERGFTTVRERVTLFGLVLVESRVRDASRINPAESRAIMIREGLVGGAFPAPLPPFLTENLARSRALLDAESKLRRHGTLFDPERAFAFYDERIPQDVCTASDLRKWIAATASLPSGENGANGKDAVAPLTMLDSDLPPPHDLEQGFPSSVMLGGNRLPLTYRHAPGESSDGITCTVPVSRLPVVAAWRSDWLVPGMLEEKLRWMLNVLPTKVRRLLQPYDETLAMCRSRMVPGKGGVAEAFAEALYAVRGVRPPFDHWREDDLPPHLRMRFVVVTEGGGEELGSGRNMDALLRLFAGREEARGTETRPPSATLALWNRDRLTHWDFGTLPQQVDVGKAGWPVISYPALVDEHDSVSLRLFADAGTAAAAHEKGVCRLFAVVLGGEPRGANVLANINATERSRGRLSLPRAVACYMTQLEMTAAQLGTEIMNATLRETFVEGKPVIRDAQAFQSRLESERGRFPAAHAARTRLVIAILQSASEMDAILSATPIARETVDDVTDQLAWLIFPGFAEAVPSAQLQQIPRYLEAMRVRIQRAQTNPAGELRKRNEVQPLWQQYVEYISQPPPPRHDKLLLEHYRWMVEEFRVSVFAQELRTPMTVSAKRLRALWDEAVK